MGKEFGHLYKLTGITYFRLSPYEQKAFAGFIDCGSVMLLRFRKSFVRFGTMFMLTYMLQNWATAENKLLHRKNPEDYMYDT